MSFGIKSKLLNSCCKKAESGSRARTKKFEAFDGFLSDREINMSRTHDIAISKGDHSNGRLVRRFPERSFHESRHSLSGLNGTTRYTQETHHYL